RGARNDGWRRCAVRHDGSAPGGRHRPRHARQCRAQRRHRRRAGRGARPAAGARFSEARARLRRAGLRSAAHATAGSRAGLLASVRAGQRARRHPTDATGGLPRAAAGSARRDTRAAGPSAVIINQWVPAAHAGDAVGDNARQLRALFRRLGHTSDLFALTIDDALEDDVRRWSWAESRDADVTILHFAMPSPLSAAFATLPGARVLCYHNVTPPHFFAPFDRGIAALTVRGRRELASLAGRVDLALGVSDYNRRELEAMGFEPTGILPLLVDTARLRAAPPVPPLERMLQDGLANILFVGRIAPNKKIEDHIRMAEVYK